MNETGHSKSNIATGNSVHPLERQVVAVFQRWRRLFVSFALARTLLFIGAASLALGLLDFVIRSNEFEQQILGAAVLLVIGAACLRRFVIPAVTARLSLVDTARCIERRFPSIDDRLSSAIDFLRQPTNDTTSGSTVLRQAVVAEAEDALTRLDVRSVIDPYRCTRAWWYVGGVSLLAALLLALDFSSASIALARLYTPWRSTPWPRWNELEFVDPAENVALGGAFTTVVVDRNQRLPGEMQVEYRFADALGHERKLVREMTLIAGRMEHRLENVTGSFRVRALGGDGETPWLNVNALAPPKVAELQVELYPPKYTQWPKTIASRRIEALRGATVAIRGTANMPLVRATLHFESSGRQKQFPLELDEEGIAFQLSADAKEPWQIEQSGAYWIELVALEEVSSSDARWEVRCLPDQPPRIECLDPAENAFATPAAVIPLKFRASDDVAIEKVELVVARSEGADKPGERREIYRTNARMGLSAETAQTTATESGSPFDTRDVEYAWAISKPELIPIGATLSFHAIASDFVPQVGSSSPIRLSIISPEELRSRLEQRLAQLVLQIAEAARQQTESRATVASLDVQVKTAGALTTNDVDRLQACELNQREVERSLIHPQQGVARQIKSLLDQYAANRLTVEGAESLAELRDELTLLGKQSLPAAQHAMLIAIKLARGESPPGDGKSAKAHDIAIALGDAQTEQTNVIETLERWLGRLAKWQNYSRFARELASLRHDQAELIVRSEAQSTLALGLTELTSQQRADLKRLAESQLDLARRFDRLRQQMEDFRRQIADTEPAAAAATSAAIAACRRLPIEENMREASLAMEENRLGAASQKEQEVVAHLTEVINELSGGRGAETVDRGKELREASSKLAQLQTRQDAIAKQLAEARDVPDDPLRRKALQRGGEEQGRAADDAKRLERQLEHLRSDLAAQAMRRAGHHAAQAQKTANEGNAENAAAESQAAAEQIRRARREVDESLKQIEQQLATESLTRLEQLVAGFLARQQGAVTEIKRLDDTRRANKDVLTRGQWTSLSDLARQEKLLADEILLLARSEAIEGSFRFAFKSAAECLVRASTALDARETGDASQVPAQQAWTRLQRMADSLSSSNATMEPSSSAGGNGGGQEGGSSSAISKAALAELKLLRFIQDDLNLRTKELEGKIAGSEPTPEQAMELNLLAKEQGDVASLVGRLIESLVPAPPANRPAENNSPAQGRNDSPFHVQFESGQLRGREISR